MERQKKGERRGKDKRQFFKRRRLSFHGFVQIKNNLTERAKGKGGEGSKEESLISGRSHDETLAENFNAILGA